MIDQISYDCTWRHTILHYESTKPYELLENDEKQLYEHDKLRFFLSSRIDSYICPS